MFVNDWRTLWRALDGATTLSIEFPVKAGGTRTALLSNSWGNDYPRELFADLFDAVVISCEVGLRKPDEAIFERHAEDLALAPQAALFFDDTPANVAAARRQMKVRWFMADASLYR